MKAFCSKCRYYYPRYEFMRGCEHGKIAPPDYSLKQKSNSKQDPEYKMKPKQSAVVKKRRLKMFRTCNSCSERIKKRKGTYSRVPLTPNVELALTVTNTSTARVVTRKDDATQYAAKFHEHRSQKHHADFLCMVCSSAATTTICHGMAVCGACQVLCSDDYGVDEFF